MVNSKVRFYVVSANDVETSGYDIENWSGYDKLPKEAKEFIKIAEENGSAWNIDQFHYEFNICESVGANDWIFVTDKH